MDFDRVLKRKTGPIRAGFLLAVILVTLMGTAGTSLATGKKSVAEKILDILRANNQISEEQYNELLKEAREEQEEREAELKAAREEQQPKAVEAKTVEEKKPSDLDVYWKNGVNVESANKEFQVHIGGRIQLDFGGIDANDQIKALAGKAGQPVQGYGDRFRRVRLAIEGTAYDTVEWKTEVDFAGGNTTLTDVWLGVKDIPYVGRIRIGHMKEPFSLEDLTSSNYITFMERALPNTFAPDRNTGIMLLDTELDKRMTWAAGAFMGQTNSSGDVFTNHSDIDLAARVTGLPWYEDQGSKLVHLGLGYVHKFRSESSSAVKTQFQSRPESYLTNLMTVSTGSLAADAVDLVNPELALIYGPFSLQGEYFQSLLDAPKAGSPDFNGYYVYASYFLTGEHRTYNTLGGIFDRVAPLADFNPRTGGWGAWEVGVRWSNLNLSDANVLGGRENNFTFGLNWYLNPTTRVMFNYVWADVQNRTNTYPVSNGALNIFQGRVQASF